MRNSGHLLLIGDHVADRPSHLADFVTRIQVDVLVEIADGQPSGRGGDLADAPSDAPRQEKADAEPETGRGDGQQDGDVARQVKRGLSLAFERGPDLAFLGQKRVDHLVDRGTHAAAALAVRGERLDAIATVQLGQDHLIAPAGVCVPGRHERSQGGDVLTIGVGLVHALDQVGEALVELLHLLAVRGSGHRVVRQQIVEQV